MLFSASKLLLGAACLVGLSLAQDDCSSGPWTDVLAIGGGGGGLFCATKWKEGTVITGIEVWANKHLVRGLQFYYSDGSNSDLIGNGDGGKTQRMDWDPSVDGIAQLKMWGNGKGEALGRVFIRTKAGDELDVGKDDTEGQDTFEPKVASGILLGAYGGHGDHIDTLGLLFLKSKIDKISVDDVVFDQDPEALNAQQEGLETVILEYADHTNSNTASSEIFTFGKLDTRTTTKTFTNKATHSFGWSNAIELSGKILDLGASSTTTLKYDYSKESSEESSTTETVTLTYTVATTLAPGQRTFCRATAMSGVYKGDYTSTVNIWLEDGSTFGFGQTGTMEQVNWSKASSECRDTDFPPEKRAVKFIS